MAATAITASAVATLPSSVPCSQVTAERITLEPAGSRLVDCACAALAANAARAVGGRIRLAVMVLTRPQPPRAG